MGKDLMATFKAVKFEFGKIPISGGYTTKPNPMTTKTIDDIDGSKNTFVKVSAHERWLVYLHNRTEPVVQELNRLHIVA